MPAVADRRTFERKFDQGKFFWPNIDMLKKAVKLGKHTDSTVEASP